MKNYRIAIVLITILTILVSIGVKVALADNPPTIISSFINDSAFVLSDSYPDGIINSLNAGATKSLFLTGVAEDLDGYSDIINVKGVFYRSGVSGGYNCSSDKNNCYIVASCSTQVVIENQNQINYSCEVPIYYFADSTTAGGHYPNDNWLVYVEATDTVSSASINTTSKEMGELLALDIPTSIEFGEVRLGQVFDAANAKQVTLSQHGNVLSSVTVSSQEDFTCFLGSFPRGNLHWATSALDWDEAVPITSTAVDAGLEIAYQENDELPTFGNLYFNLALPASGAKGLCTSQTDIIAVAAE